MRLEEKRPCDWRPSIPSTCKLHDQIRRANEFFDANIKAHFEVAYVVS